MISKMISLNMTASVIRQFHLEMDGENLLHDIGKPEIGQEILSED